MFGDLNRSGRLTRDLIAKEERYVAGRVQSTCSQDREIAAALHGGVVNLAVHGLDGVDTVFVFANGVAQPEIEAAWSAFESSSAASTPAPTKTQRVEVSDDSDAESPSLRRPPSKKQKKRDKHEGSEVPMGARPPRRLSAHV